MQTEELSSLPRRMFAPGHEPVGIRVTSYHPSSGIRAILKALDVDEVDLLRRSPFAKFLTIADQPAFSGRFGKFIISRQLKVKKKHEAWFLFGGKPIRFSLREFAIVTGLPCGKYPKKSKKKLKSNIKETPYWPTLFGKLQSVTVASVIRMLEKKMVTDKELRIKYACLALVASVLLPTTHHPKIVKEHAELIKDLEGFFAYPWGRVGFEMLMGSIKERNEITLSQKTVAIKGFVHALQLVIVEAVPALTEVIQVNESSESEAEEDGEDTIEKEGRPKKISISPGHARDIHLDGQASVDCIIADDGEYEIADSTFMWSDDDEDEEVNNLVKLINDEHIFENNMFVGGATKDDVIRMRQEAEEKNAKAKKRKCGANSEEGVVGRCNGEGSCVTDTILHQVADLMSVKLKEELVSVGEKLDNCNQSIADCKTKLICLEMDIMKLVDMKMEKIQVALIDNVKQFFEKSIPIPHNLGTESHSEGMGDGHVDPDFPDGLNPKPNHQKDAVENIINNVNTSINDANRRTTLMGKENPLEVGGLFGGDDCHNGQRDGGPSGVNVGFNDEIECERVVNVLMQGLDTGDYDGAEAEVPGFGLVRTTPSFSLGLSKEEVGKSVVEVSLGYDNGNCRKSKRLKTVPSALVEDYQCDMGIIQRARLAQLGIYGDGQEADYVERFTKLEGKLQFQSQIYVGCVTVSGKDIIGIVERSRHMPPKLVDALMHYTRALHLKQACLGRKVEFLDTKFVSLLSKIYPKFVGGPKKDGFKFPKVILQFFNGEHAHNPNAQRFYLPFNFDKNHWVGLCVDCLSGVVHVLDCNIALRNEAAILRELSPFAYVFPYVLQQSGRKQHNREVKPYTIERAKGIPQNTSLVDSAITAVLLMQGHAIAGMDVCRCITPAVLPTEARRLAVLLYEENCPTF